MLQIPNENYHNSNLSQTGGEVMTILEFTAPPLPYYIASGFEPMRPGRKHPNRRSIGVFDLLVVTSGCLYMGEEDRHYDVTAGHALILRPDCHHYPVQPCLEPTEHYWLHFGTTGAWSAAETLPSQPAGEREEKKYFTMETFPMRLPQFIRLPRPAAVYEPLRQLTELEPESHRSWARWKLQLTFQSVLEQLSGALEAQAAVPGAKVAERAASYLRAHYREVVTAPMLGEALNFHPVYIARCMQQEFGCSPFEYLMHYRLEQAKLKLLQTDLSIARIAEEVGFNQPAYFTSCFTKQEGVTPRMYRKRFSHE
ncbi:AraC family transcriptional regulator [Paenibacillus mucilaginosus K02]|uniref:AraC family transcriptional regulator n=2 Tax=Paenibacillus mucilaginosus TaxID=61624 RepID=I0BC36_9BACL|nr:AraC family transcriptional regulator [Paenibacillus mucilaginosus K02]